MHLKPTLQLKFAILVFISAILNLQEALCSSNKTLAYFDFSVIHAQNSSTDSRSKELSSYFCVIDLLADFNSRINEDFLPLNNFLVHNLCKSASLSSITAKGNGYYIFNYSTICSAAKQIDNFEKHFPQSSALIFSTSCDLNLNTNFNLTSEYVSKKSFRISVISDARVKNLLAFKQVQQITPYESKFQTFQCMILIFSIAVFCVIVGSYWSGTLRYKLYIDSKQKSQRSALVRRDSSSGEKPEKSQNPQDAFAELSIGSVLFAVMTTIAVLMALYFFYKYIVYFFIAIFMIFSGVSFFGCSNAILTSVLPKSITNLSFNKSPCFCVKNFSLPYLYLPLAALSIGLPVYWFCIRHTSDNAWILQDILCVCFCVFQLRTLRLPSFKICTMLLGALFIYDIFFVFITPLFTKNGVSIMEYVATGGISNRGTLSENRCPGEKAEVLPLSIRTPRSIFGQNPHYTKDFCMAGGYSLLGLGDIIIPGIMVSYSHAYDLIRQVPRRSYFIASSIGYAVGLMFSYIALITMEIAQPALLYLVPTTIASVLIVALVRKEFWQFWSGPEESIELSDRDSSSTEVESSASLK